MISFRLRSTGHLAIYVILSILLSGQEMHGCPKVRDDARRSSSDSTPCSMRFETVRLPCANHTATQDSHALKFDFHNVARLELRGLAARRSHRNYVEGENRE